LEEAGVPKAKIFKGKYEVYQENLPNGGGATYRSGLEIKFFFPGAILLLGPKF